MIEKKVNSLRTDRLKLSIHTSSTTVPCSKWAPVPVRKKSILREILVISNDLETSLVKCLMKCYLQPLEWKSYPRLYIIAGIFFRLIAVKHIARNATAINWENWSSSAWPSAMDDVGDSHGMWKTLYTSCLVLVQQTSQAFLVNPLRRPRITRPEKQAVHNNEAKELGKYMSMIF